MKQAKWLALLCTKAALTSILWAGPVSTVVAACIDMPVSCRISSQFGPRLHPVRKEWRNHNGTDFACPVGTPVLSATDGVVAFSGFHSGGGNMMTIRSGSMDLKYMHNHRNIAEIGMSVGLGDEIAKSGNTGAWTTGPHLHFETWVGGRAVDPMSLSCSGGGGQTSVTPSEGGRKEWAAVPPGEEGVPRFEWEVRDGLDGSFWDIMSSAIGSRALNPDYYRQISDLDMVRLAEELNYLEGINMRTSMERYQAHQRILQNRAIINAIKIQRKNAAEIDQTRREALRSAN